MPRNPLFLAPLIEAQQSKISVMAEATRPSYEAAAAAALCGAQAEVSAAGLLITPWRE